MGLSRTGESILRAHRGVLVMNETLDRLHLQKRTQVIACAMRMGLVDDAVIAKAA
jgi:hypothetical protein